MTFKIIVYLALFAVLASAQANDDYPFDYETQGYLSANASLAGTINFLGDRDMFFTYLANSTYTFTITSGSSRVLCMNLIRMFGSSGNTIDQTNSSASGMVRTTNQTSLYYVTVYDCNNQGVSNYTITLRASSTICSSNCTACSPSDGCTACNNNLLPLGTDCVNSCPNGLFNHNGKCAPCRIIDPYCSSCQNGICLTCVSFRRLINGTCQDTCGAGNFLSDTGCESCTLLHPKCSSCSRDDQCTACNNGLKAYGAYCVDVCPQGSVEYLGNCVECLSRMEDCVSCSIHNDTMTCDVCVTGYSLNSNGRCASTCGSSSFFNGSTCISCQTINPNCTSCFSADVCVTCNGSLMAYERSCAQSCPTGSYESLNHCFSCSSFLPNCTSCSLGNASFSCHTCQNGTFLYNNTVCLNDCPVGTFAAQGRCIQCNTIDPDCVICSNSSVCERCAPASNGVRRLLSQGTCVSQCDSVSYGDNGVCKSCSTAISNCSMCYDASHCIACSRGYLFNGSCVATCGTGYYVGQHNTCMPCSSINNFCTTCTNTFCITCSDGYIVSGATCLPCSSGSFVLNNRCSSCNTLNTNCSTCNNSSTCTSCLNGLIAYQNTCVSTCPNSTYLSVNSCRNCSTFDSSCTTCSASAGCLTCSANKYLYNGTCVTTCPSTAYLSGSTCRDCTTFSANCTSCNISGCLRCNVGYYAYAQSCVSSCPSNTYNNNGICTLCSSLDASCTTCSNAQTCLTCSSNKVTYGASCRTTCPTTTFNNFGNCQLCSNEMASCATCSNNSTCLSCSDNKVLLNGVCVPGCPADYYVNAGVCTRCNTLNSNCNACSNSTTCLACANSLLASDADCVTICPQGKYQNVNSCANCSTLDPYCTLCNSANTCLACSSGRIRFGASCVAFCPTGYYNNTGQCQLCSSSNSDCTACSDASYCLVCTNQKFAFNGTCNYTCPAGLIPLGGVCTTRVTSMPPLTAEEVKQAESTAESRNNVGSVTTAVSTIASLTNAGNPAAVAMASFAGMFQNLGYLKINYPGKLSVMYAKGSKPSLLEGMFSPLSDKLANSTQRLLSADSSTVGQSGTAFLINFWSMLCILILLLVIVGIVTLAERLTDKNGAAHKTIVMVRERLRWSFCIVIFTSFFQKLFLLSAFEYKYSKADTGFKVFSILVSVILNIIAILLLVKMYLVAKKIVEHHTQALTKRLDTAELPNGCAPYKVVHENYKKDSMLKQAFLPIFLFRISLASVIIGSMTSVPVTQCAILLTLSVLMLIYVAAVRPFLKIIDIVTFFLQEGSLLMTYICTLALAVMSENNSQDFDKMIAIGQAIVVSNMIFTVVSSGSVVIQAIIMVVEVVKGSKKSKFTRRVHDAKRDSTHLPIYVTQQPIQNLEYQSSGYQYVGAKECANTINFDASYSPEPQQSPQIISQQQFLYGDANVQEPPSPEARILSQNTTQFAISPITLTKQEKIKEAW